MRPKLVIGFAAETNDIDKNDVEISKYENENEELDEKDFYKFNDDDIQISLRYWGETDLFFNNHSDGNDNVPNIAWVRSRELAKGIKIPVHGSPMDGKKFTKYCDQTMKYLGDMYNKYMTPKQSKGKITIKSEHIR